MKKILCIDGFNPEPWTVPDAAIGRAKGSGRPYAYFVKDGRLANYQTGIAETVRNAYPDLVPFPDETKLQVEFFLWRQLEEYTTGKGRKSKRHVADATNCGKAIEDALQGVLYTNDRWNVAAWPTIVDQNALTKPTIIVVAQEIKLTWGLKATDWRPLITRFVNSGRDVFYWEEESDATAPLF